MRVILHIDIKGISSGGLVRLYRACREHKASIRRIDPASNAFHVYMRVSESNNDIFDKVKKLAREINQVSTYCEVSVTAIIPHEDLPQSSTASGQGCPKGIEKYLKKACVKYLRSTHEGRGILEVNGSPVLIICRRRTTQILPLEGSTDTYLLMAPPTLTRFACTNTKKLNEILKQLKDAASLLRHCLT